MGKTSELTLIKIKGVGPIYGVDLIDELPLGKNGGMTQSMPNADDLRAIAQDHTRVVAGYEVLLDHYQQLKAVVDEHLQQRKCRDCGNIGWHKDSITPYVNCKMCGSQDTRLIRK